jgi:hypothetical protein
LPSAACLSPADAALYLSTQQAKALLKLSQLELEDRKIPGWCLIFIFVRIIFIHMLVQLAV